MESGLSDLRNTQTRWNGLIVN